MPEQSSIQKALSTADALLDAGGKAIEVRTHPAIPPSSALICRSNPVLMFLSFFLCDINQLAFRYAYVPLIIYWGSHTIEGGMRGAILGPS